MLQNYSNSSAARSDTKISKGKSATVTTQGRSSIAATQPRKKTCEPNRGYDSAQKMYIPMFHHPGTHTKLMVRHAPIWKMQSRKQNLKTCENVKTLQELLEVSGVRTAPRRRLSMNTTADQDRACFAARYCCRHPKKAPKTRGCNALPIAV